MFAASFLRLYYVPDNNILPSTTGCIMDDGDDNTLPPSVVGDDVNSTAESSVSHSFYSNSLFNMIRDEDISDMIFCIGSA